MKFGYSGRISGSNSPRSSQHAPARPPVTVTPASRLSLFGNTAAVAGGVTVGTTMGHLAGEAISGLFGGGRRREVEQVVLPTDYNYDHVPSGPCTYEISQFLNCATNRDNIADCCCSGRSAQGMQASQSGRSGGRYNPRTYQHAPARPPPMIVTPAPRRSLFRDAAAVAGGVTVGTTMGHLAGEAISGLFGGGGRRHQVEQALPPNYNYNQEPSGPCAYEISEFLGCATNRDNIEDCAPQKQALMECKRRNRIP